MNKNNKNLNNIACKFYDKYAYIIFALLVSILAQGIAVKWFFKNTHLAVSGLSGVALGISYIFEKFHIPISYGVINISFNIPLIVIAWKMLNPTFAIFSAINIVLAGFLVDFIPVWKLTDDVLINTILGAVVYSFAALYALRAGISTGGTDIIGVVMAKRGLGSVGSYVIYVTFIAFALTWYTSDFKMIAYSLIAAFIMNILIDRFYEQSSKVTMLIISEKAEKINKILQMKLKRGSTMWKAKGGYTSEDKEIIMMTISSDQKPLLKNISKKIDERSFIISLNTESTIGEWTSRLGERKYYKKETKIENHEIHEI